MEAKTNLEIPKTKCRVIELPTRRHCKVIILVDKDRVGMSGRKGSKLEISIVPQDNLETCFFTHTKKKILERTASRMAGGCDCESSRDSKYSAEHERNRDMSAARCDYKASSNSEYTAKHECDRQMPRRCDYKSSCDLEHSDEHERNRDMSGRCDYKSSCDSECTDEHECNQVMSRTKPKPVDGRCKVIQNRIANISTEIKEMSNEIEVKSQSKHWPELSKNLHEIEFLMNDIQNILSKQPQAQCKAPCNQKSEQPANCCERKESVEPTLGTQTEDMKCVNCHGQSMPVIKNNLEGFLQNLCGHFKTDNFALTILLQHDNIFHVNVTKLDTGKSLGCFLVSECCLDEAMDIKLFQRYHAFFLVEAKCNREQKDKIFKLALKMY